MKQTPIPYKEFLDLLVGQGLNVQQIMDKYHMTNRPPFTKMMQTLGLTIYDKKKGYESEIYKRTLEVIKGLQDSDNPFKVVLENDAKFKEDIKDLIVKKFAEEITPMKKRIDAIDHSFANMVYILENALKDNLLAKMDNEGINVKQQDMRSAIGDKRLAEYKQKILSKELPSDEIDEDEMVKQMEEKERQKNLKVAEAQNDKQ